MILTDLAYGLFDIGGVLAQGGASQGDQPQQPFWVTMAPLILMMVIFYFLLIRPQQKRQKEHQQLIAAVKTGDKIVSSAGIHGIVTNVKESTVIVKIADNVKIEMDRSAIMTRTSGDAADVEK